MKRLSKHVLWTLGALAVTTSLVVAGTHHFRHHGPAHYAGWMVDKVTRELDLDQTQRDKLVVLKDELIKVHTSIRDDRKDVHAEVLELLTQPQLDRARILSMINERADALHEHAPQVVNAAGDFYDSLSAEQRDELRQRALDRWEHHYDDYDNEEREGEHHDS